MRPGPCPRRLLLCIALATAPGTALAEAAGADSLRIQQLERRLEQSLQMIEALRRKVEALEQARQPAEVDASPAAASEVEPRLNALERQFEGLEHALEAAPARAGAGLPLHGFADVGAGYSGEDNAEFGRGRKGFAVGTLDLYLTPDFGGNVRSLIELVVELEEDGEPLVDLERAQMGYVFSDALTLWLGRFHNPFGYWNTAFHHGAQLQTSILRPRFLDFEDMGGIIPAHGVGLWATGKLHPGGQGIDYDLYVANAPEITGAVDGEGALDVKVSGRDDFHAMAGFSLAWMPAAVGGLRIGAHGLRARVESDRGNATRLNMLGGFAAFTDGPWELIAEAYRFRNEDISGDGARRGSSAWYAQAAYQSGPLTPFVRLERTDLDQQDNYFLDQENGRSYRRLALGLRYELDYRAALKLEYDRTRKRDLAGADDDYSEARVQYAIRF